MTLHMEDYNRLISDSDVDVMEELIKLNQQMYNQALDVIALAREINLKRIQGFLKITQAK